MASLYFASFALAMRASSSLNEIAGWLARQAAARHFAEQ
jgi:hypothetical protein